MSPFQTTSSVSRFVRAISCCIAALVALCLAPGASLAQEDIHWYGAGDPRNSQDLATTPSPPAGGANSLFPTVSSSRNRNNLYVYGQVDGHVMAGRSNSTYNVYGNNVYVLGTTVVGNVYGGVAAGANPATATSEQFRNYVYITDSVIGKTSPTTNQGRVYGAYAGGSANGDMYNNHVIIRNSTIYNSIYGVGSVGTTPSAVYGNSVSISGDSMIDGTVYGGFSGTGAVYDNSILVSGGTFTKNIIAGYTDKDSNATSNAITITGNPAFGATTTLSGGNTVGAGGTGDHFSGNTLNVWDYHGGSVYRLHSFENYNFSLPSGTTAGSTALTVTDSVTLAPAGKNATFTGINIVGGGTTSLADGESVTLIAADSIDGTANWGRAQGSQGLSILYDWDVALDGTGKNIVATVVSRSANPRAKALSEGRIAGAATLNHGADMVAGAAMHAARTARPAGESGIGVFGVAQGGKAQYDSGSHVNVKSVSMAAGLAWNANTSLGGITLGAFFEAGHGNYDSHNSFRNFDSVKGEGDTDYYGGGILGRMDFAKTGPGTLYVEASGRSGSVKTDFDTSDLHDAGKKATYETDVNYYGVHAGLGYEWNMTENSILDLYTKYLWTRQEGSTEKIANDTVKFEDMNSQRWRTGARYSYNFATRRGNTFAPYAGLAYEHEFDAVAKASAYGQALDEPDLKGGTGIAEIGFTFANPEKTGLAVDLGLQGYMGVREGVSGNLQLKYEF